MAKLCTMKVYWRSLCTLGATFWAGMSAYDHFLGSIINPGEFAVRSETELVEEPVLLPNIKIEPDCIVASMMDNSMEYEQLDGTPFLWAYILSTLFLFSAMVVYVMVKFITRTSSVDRGMLDVCQSCGLDSPHNSNTIQTFYAPSELICTNTDVQTMPMAKCGSFPNLKMRDEVVETNASWKEVSVLNKKIEALTEEKRSLSKFLALAEKDNRSSKQKMMEVLREKNLLLKRLEAATKEIRSNTVARQATLDKLEESLHCSNHLKVQLQQMTQQKIDLERKIRTLDVQVKSLKKQSPSAPRPISNVNVKSIDSTRDLEQIESKLHDLEASLEKMKCKSFVSETSTSTSTTPRVAPEKDDEQAVSERSSELRLVRQITPALGIKLTNDFHSSSSRINSSSKCKGNFGNTLFNLLLNVEQQNSECARAAASAAAHTCLVSAAAARRDPVVVQYSIHCLPQISARFPLLPATAKTSLLHGGEPPKEDADKNEVIRK